MKLCKTFGGSVFSGHFLAQFEESRFELDPSKNQDIRGKE